MRVLLDPEDVPEQVPTQVPPMGATQVPSELQRADAMAAYNTQLLGPLVALVERQEGTIREQAEEAGRLRAQA